MRLRHIEVFNAVMLTGSVSGAARLISVTQPAVSRTLAHAELQLGFALFERSRNRLVPTREALALYPHVEDLFARLDQVQRLADTLKAGRGAGELRVASILTLGHEVMPRAVKIFRAKYPGVAVALRTLHTPEIVSALVLREADVGFCYDLATHDALHQERMAEASMVCVAPRGLLPARAVKLGRLSLADLAGLDVIGLDAADPIGQRLSHACREAGVSLATPVTVQTYHAALALARHGVGAALVDACTALSADAAQVDIVPLSPAIPVPVHAARPAQGAGSVTARAFTRAVQQILSQLFGAPPPPPPPP